MVLPLLLTCRILRERTSLVVGVLLAACGGSKTAGSETDMAGSPTMPETSGTEASGAGATPAQLPQGAGGMAIGTGGEATDIPPGGTPTGGAVGVAMGGAAGTAGSGGVQQDAGGAAGAMAMAGAAGTAGSGGVQQDAGGTAGTMAIGGAAATGGAAGTAGSGGVQQNAGGAAGAMATGGSPSGGAGGVTNVDSPLVPLSELVGWASVDAEGQPGTTGGGNQPAVEVDSLDAFEALVADDSPQVVVLNGSVSGIVQVGSNKTIVGGANAEFVGSLRLEGSVNVILYNLRLVGYNCPDGNCDDDSRMDTLLVTDGTHHVWVHHADISDGTDGNFDITQGSDYITVSWTRFSYSTDNREHRFSNLIGGDDDVPGDVGHLNVTFHHNWWAERVVERMPRARYGKVHIFNNLYTASGNNYCIGVGMDANILTENNVFINVDDPINSQSYSNDASIVLSRGNIYTGTTGMTDDRGNGVFTPPYDYTPDPADGVEDAVRAGAGLL